MYISYYNIVIVINCKVQCFMFYVCIFCYSFIMSCLGKINRGQCIWFKIFSVLNFMTFLWHLLLQSFLPLQVNVYKFPKCQSLYKLYTSTKLSVLRDILILENGLINVAVYIGAIHLLCIIFWVTQIYHFGLGDTATGTDHCNHWISLSLLFTASVRSRKPEPTAVPGVFTKSLRLILLYFY